MINISCSCGYTAPWHAFTSDAINDHTYTCPKCNLAWNRLHYFKKLWLEDAEFRRKFKLKVSQSKLFGQYTELDWRRHARLERQFKKGTSI
jgi:hypothetical protein